jgi:CelD/BcsL family acetyltransferase involved in cellulose biosynthesis
VEPGKTGFLVHNQEEMAEAIQQVGNLSPEDCRRAARERFSADRMVNHYLGAYDRLIHRSVRIVSGVEVQTEPLQSLESEWQELFERCPDASPFQSPDWLLPWWTAFGQSETWMLTMRSRGRLTALAPLVVQGRKAMLMGSGISDYLDVLAEPGVEVSPFVSYLSRHRSHWSICEFTPEDRPLKAPPELAISERDEGIFPYLELPNLPEVFDAGLPPRMLRNLERDENRLRRAGSLNYEVADRANLEEFLEALFTLHGARWNTRGEDGVLADESVRLFHRLSAPRLLSRGLLRLYGLRHDRSLIAVLHVMVRNRRAYYYIGGFAPDHAKYSPGSLLLRHSIHDSIRQGLETFDLLRGDEPYKYRWGARSRSIRRRILKSE